MEKRPSVSVIIPVYNVEKYLSRCLDSVQKQTLKNIEIVCVNDGATDNSLQILQKYAAQDSRIKIITQPNKGLSGARNSGLDAANGEYIFFLDADDWLHAQALELFYVAACQSNAPVVVSTKFCRLGKDAVRQTIYDTTQMQLILRHTPLQNIYRHRRISAVAWNKLYRSDVLKNRRFIEGILYEDWPFTACLFADINCYAEIGMPLYIYNTTSPSITRSSFTIKKIHDYVIGIYHVAEYFATPERQKMWRLVQRRRIALSIKMMLSKISKSTENQAELEAYFKKEFLQLWHTQIVCCRDLSPKTLFRLCRLLWHQR